MRSVILAATAGALAGITCGQNLPAPSAGTSEWRFGGQTGGVVERAFGPGELAFADGPGGATSMVDVFTTTQAAGIPDIGGVDTPVLYSDRHINPLGYHVRPLTGQAETRFTLVWDLYSPSSSDNGDWSALWQSADNLADAELHLEHTSNGFWHDLNNSGVGAGSGALGSWAWDDWFRVVYVCDTPGGTAQIYVDGVLVFVDVPVDVLPDGSGAAVSWFMSDQNSNSWPCYVAAFAVADVALNDADVATLGAPHPAGIFDGGTLGTPYCVPAVVNSTGAFGVLGASGSLTASSNAFVLTASALPPQQFGYFIGGRFQGFIPQPGGSQGNLCLSIPLARFIASLQSSGAGGVMTHQVDLTAIPLTPPVAVVAGETWNFQAWYRDANPGPTSNFTTALSATFQ